ncbi:MAG: hypothetical protein H7A23_22540 [Leptospiraceae bacterium]|nr:hypothetical protein [Leptospiraceae bacterium]MCP5497342.1 hypothetical protein [Leptospiraceae bacterium]
MKKKESYIVNVIHMTEKDRKEIERIEKEVEEEDKNLDFSKLKIHRPKKK